MAGDPKPVTPGLEARFQQTLAKIPTGRRILVGAAATTAGVEGYGAFRVNPHGSIVGWAGRETATKEVSAGVRTEWSW